MSPRARPPSGDLTGTWRIVELELWDMTDADLLGPGFVQFLPGGVGSLRFITVTGDIDWRREDPRIEFSWAGFDEMDPASGRGWAEIEADGTLRGCIYFHHGDSSDFRAERSANGPVSLPASRATL